MKRLGLSLILVALGSLVGAGGCELQSCENEEGESAVCLKSLTRFVGAEITPDPLPYAAGTDLTINGNYGNITVDEGSPGEVSVVIEPFNYRAHDAEEQARDEIENNFDYSFEDSGGAIVVTTGRHDATNGLGAAVTVYIPPEFDGAMVLRNQSDGAVNPGDINVDFVGGATSVDMSTDSLGDCGVYADGGVLSTTAHCDGTIVAQFVSDYVDIESTGLEGSIAVTLSSVAGQNAGGSITSEDGNIEVVFPPGGAFSVQAQSTEDAIVDGEALDDVCEASAAAETAKSYTCGAGGPNYVVTAGTDGVGPSGVTLYF
jgi:hypothetical protein